MSVGRGPDVDCHPSPATLRWVRDAVGAGSVVASLTPMGVRSTVMHAVDVFGPTGVLHHLALRRYHRTERLRKDPWYVPANEVAVLELLAGTDVPAPRVLAADLTPSVCDMPTLLTTRVPGEPPVHPSDVEGFLTDLAGLLAVIHAVEHPVVSMLPPYRPYYDRRLDGVRRPPVWSRAPRLWDRVFEVLAGQPPNAPAGFIHRDYHPGQTLWNGGLLVGVVDWTTGCRGPRGIDLARMRLNLAGRYGVDVAERFLGLYRTTGWSDAHHPYWDLLDAADGILDLPAPTTSDEQLECARVEDWVARGLARL